MGILFNKENKYVPTRLKDWYMFHIDSILRQRKVSSPQNLMYQKYKKDGDIILGLIQTKDSLHSIMKESTNKEIEALSYSIDDNDLEYAKKLQETLHSEGLRLYGKEIREMLDKVKKDNEDYSKSIAYCERQYWFTLVTFMGGIFGILFLYVYIVLKYN